MKTLKQISDQHDIAKNTLVGRIRFHKITPGKSGKAFLISKAEEELIVKPIMQRKTSLNLIREYMGNHPHLCIDEVAQVLAISPKIVLQAVCEFYTIESKMNNN